MHCAILNLALLLLPAASPVAGGEAAGGAPAAADHDLFAFYSAGFERILSDPRDAGLLGLLENFEPMLALAGEQSGQPIPSVAGLAVRWIARPFCLRGTVDRSGLPQVQLDVAWSDHAVARKEFAQFRDELESVGIKLTSSDADAGSMTAMTPAGPFAAKLVDTDRRSTLSLTLGRDRAPAFRMPEVSLPTGVVPVFAMNWDGHALDSLLEKTMTGAENAKIRRLLDELGIAGPNAMEISVAMGHGGTESITTTHVKGWSETFLGKGTTAPLERADLEVLPADTLWGWVGNVDLSRFLDLAREIEKQEVDQGLGMAEQMLGLDIEHDLVERIGPLMGLYSSRATGGASGPMGLVGFAECDQPKAVVSSIEKLLKMAVLQSQTKIATNRWQHGEYACTTFAVPGTMVPVEPSLAIAGDKLFFAASRSALTEALDQLGREESVVDHPRIAELPDAALQNLVAFGFYDAKAGLERGYGILGMLNASLGNLLAGTGADFDVSELPDISDLVPSYADLARGSRPTVSLTYVKSGDLLQAVTHDSSTVARLTAAAGSPMSFAGPGSAAVVSSVAIPKLMSARNESNETAVIATLHDLSNAQATFRASLAVDLDADGTGEYGTLGEMAGTRPLRGTDAALDPPLLGSSMGTLIPDGCGGTVFQKSGYYYQVWIPGTGNKMVGDAPEGANAPAWRVDPEAAEHRWCVYAWPVEAGATGVRSFFTDQQGEVYACTPSGPDGYTGLCGEGGNQPAFGAAYADGGSWRLPAFGNQSSDGKLWQPIP